MKQNSQVLPLGGYLFRSGTLQGLLVDDRPTSLRGHGVACLRGGVVGKGEIAKPLSRLQPPMSVGGTWCAEARVVEILWVSKKVRGRKRRLQLALIQDWISVGPGEDVFSRAATSPDPLWWLDCPVGLVESPSTRGLFSRSCRSKVLYQAGPGYRYKYRPVQRPFGQSREVW